MRSKCERCHYYKSEESCFSCPYTDCIWDGKIGIHKPTKEEKLEQYKERMEWALMEYNRQKALGNSKEMTRYRNKVSYCERCIAKLGDEL